MVTEAVAPGAIGIGVPGPSTAKGAAVESPLTFSGALPVLASVTVLVWLCPLVTAPKSSVQDGVAEISGARKGAAPL